MTTSNNYHTMTYTYSSSGRNNIQGDEAARHVQLKVQGVGQQAAHKKTQEPWHTAVADVGLQHPMLLAQSAALHLQGDHPAPGSSPILQNAAAESSSVRPLVNARATGLLFVQACSPTQHRCMTLAAPDSLAKDKQGCGTQVAFVDAGRRAAPSAPIG